MSYRPKDEIIKQVENEAVKCNGCRKCLHNCPMLEEFCRSPKELLEGILESREIEETIPFSCALCGYCTAVCPTRVDLNSLFYEMRKDIHSTNKGFPNAVKHKPVKQHQKASFSKALSTGVEGLDKSGPVKRVFFPGCSLTASRPDLVIKAYEYLIDRLPGTGIMINCCGRPTEAMGDMDSFNDYYSRVQQSFDNEEVQEVVVACLNCFKTLSKNSPNLKVVTLWQLIPRLGIPEDKLGLWEDNKNTFSIHDPCPTREDSDIHSSIREITMALKLRIVEMKYSREQTLCCGSGGMLGVTNRGLALGQMKKRAQQATGDYILTYCQECVDSMRLGGKRSLHILDLLFSDSLNTEESKQKSLNTIRKWSNRYLIKGRVRRYLREVNSNGDN